MIQGAARTLAAGAETRGAVTWPPLRLNCTSGNPGQIVERLEHRRAVVGEFEQCVCTKFAGLALDQATKSMNLFASEVLRTLRAG